MRVFAFIFPLLTEAGRRGHTSHETLDRAAAKSTNRGSFYTEEASGTNEVFNQSTESIDAEFHTEQVNETAESSDTSIHLERGNATAGNYGEWFHIHSPAAPGLCLDWFTDRKYLYMSKCHDGANQKWYFDGDARHGGRHLKTQWSTQACLDHNFQTNQIYLHGCHGGKNQYWLFKSHGGHYNTLMTGDHNLCADMSWGDKVVYMNRCHGEQNQKFSTAGNVKVKSRQACLVLVKAYYGGAIGHHREYIKTRQGRKWESRYSKQTEERISGEISASAGIGPFKVSGTMSGGYKSAMQSAAMQSGYTDYEKETTFYVDFSKPLFLYQGKINYIMTDGTKITMSGIVIQSPVQLKEEGCKWW